MKSKSIIKSVFLSILLLIVHTTMMAQDGKTANDTIPEYSGKFRFGTNMGYPSNGKWSNEKMADLCAGNSELGIDGAGMNSLRLSLPEHFLEEWGYNIRIKANEYYRSLGMNEHVAFIGFPSAKHTDTTHYCSKGNSLLFANMYAPIWDAGENGTPVNDTNYLAIYVYKMVLAYGDYVRFWEIGNEPDFTSTSAGWQSASADDNWWTRDPLPEELDNLLAPIEQYIRMMRVCYEVIKYVDNEDFVCTGGIGYNSFLDAILRNTDNPSGGDISPNYPNKGGAYFDCLSYHCYPMYSMRKWENGGWNYSRNSDNGVEITIEKQTEFVNLLAKYGYDGKTYPAKQFIITETNVPSIATSDYIGSEEAQRNYLTKLIIAGQKSNILSIQTFSLYDGKLASSATDPYHSMGFYTALDNIEPYDQTEKPAVLACRTMMQQIYDGRYNGSKTEQMNLPSEISGAAFELPNGNNVYVLWAKTEKDKNETATAQYSFPKDMNITSHKIVTWDGVESEGTAPISLNGSPIFITTTNKNNQTKIISSTKESNSIQPNPSKNTICINSVVKPNHISIIDLSGKTVLNFAPESWPMKMDVSSLPQGLYTIICRFETGSTTERFIKQ